MPFFRTAFAMEDKIVGGVFDPVTEADRAAENAMRRLIGETFPDHGVIGEEFGARETTPNMSGCSTRSTAPRVLFPACRCGAR